MIKDKKILGVITARSGSKGLKNKNILKLNSRPLLYWPIKTFKNSKFIDEFILSTDSIKISKQANKYKCKTPFLRPARLSKDNSSSIDVVIHAINFFKKQKITFDYVALLEPTSPLTDSVDLDLAIKKLETNCKYADSIVGVSKNVNHHPDYNVKMKKKSLINFATKKVKRRQKISDLFFLDGSLYISKIETLLKYKSFYHKKTLGFEMPKWKSFEIDDYTDFLCVSTIIKHKRRL
mgnify:CR=1 FL=1